MPAQVFLLFDGPLTASARASERWREYLLLRKSTRGVFPRPHATTMRHLHSFSSQLPPEPYRHSTQPLDDGDKKTARRRSLPEAPLVISSMHMIVSRPMLFTAARRFRWGIPRQRQSAYAKRDPREPDQQLLVSAQGT